MRCRRQATARKIRQISPKNSGDLWYQNLHAHLIPKCSHADLFSVGGRAGLAPSSSVSMSRQFTGTVPESSFSQPARWGLVLRRRNTQHLLLGSNAAPEFSLRLALHSPLLTVLGEPHGRNLASALMRSRVHNRTSDRGGKPIRLAWPWALPPVLPEGPGALSHDEPVDRDALGDRVVTRCSSAPRGRHEGGPL